MANPTTYFLFLDQNSGNPLPGGLTVTVYPQGASQIPGNVVSSGTTDANGAAPLQLAASTYYTAVFTGTGAPAYPYNFQTGAFSQVVGPFVDTVNNQTIAGTKTFSTPIGISSGGTGSSTLAGAGIALTGTSNTFTGSQTINSGDLTVGGKLFSQQSASTGQVAFGSAGATLFYNGTAYNFYKTDGSSALLTINATSGAVASNSTIQAIPVGSSTAGFVAPGFVAAGTSIANSVHFVQDKITASGASTTVTLAAAASFALASSYIVLVTDTATGAAATVTAQSASSFTFTSVSGHVYSFVCIGT